MSSSRDTSPGTSIEPIEIFRVGTHTAMGGQTATYSEEMLQSCVDAYDPQKHEAPIVLGHPEHNTPAYGWVESLSVQGGSLFAKVKEVAQEFSELVQEGRFKKISPSFWPKGNRGNPVPSSLYLRHVGFLGAAIPAVRGMKNAEFTDDGAGLLTFGDDDYSGFAPHVQALLKGNESEQFLEKMIGQGRVLPVHQQGLLAFMGSLSNDNIVSFADSNGTLHNAGSLQWFKDYIAEQPQVVQFGQHPMDDDDIPQETSFNAPTGFKVDPDGLALHSRATKLVDEKEISYSDAVLLAASEKGRH